MGKFQECQLKATKCRNDYLMTLAATNTTLQKYFKQDVMSLIDVSSYSIVFSEKHTKYNCGEIMKFAPEISSGNDRIKLVLLRM